MNELNDWVLTGMSDSELFDDDIAETKYNLFCTLNKDCRNDIVGGAVITIYEFENIIEDARYHWRESNWTDKEQMNSNIYDFIGGGDYCETILLNDYNLGVTSKALAKELFQAFLDAGFEKQEYERGWTEDKFLEVINEIYDYIKTGGD
jgi:hypothetical protein